MGRELVYSNTICYKCYIVRWRCIVMIQRRGSDAFPLGVLAWYVHSVPWKCAYRTRILHGMVMLTWVRGVVSYWECSRGSWREGPEAYTYQVPAYRHSIVQIRTCLYVPGACLTHTFPTRQGGEDFHAWAHDDQSGQSPIHFEWTLSALSPGCRLFNIFVPVCLSCWLVLMCFL